MAQDVTKIVKNIKFHSRIKKYLTFICFLLIIVGFLSFFLYGLFVKNSAIQFVNKFKDKENVEIEKVMLNPKIKFEHNKNDYYDVKAKKAIHKNDNDMLLFDVQADGEAINITSQKLLITQNGNNLKFTGKPVLIIKQNPKNK